MTCQSMSGTGGGKSNSASADNPHPRLPVVMTRIPSAAYGPPDGAT
jgi:hypothetical protein